MRIYKIIPVIFLSFCIFTPKNTSAASLSGLEVMQKAYDRYDGDDSFAKLDMVLIDKKGNERKRSLIIHVKDYGNLIKTHLEFQTPADIEGTKFLSLEVEGKDDTQYLYLPALGRSRRIVSNQKNLRFVNTDYTYEDMQRRLPDKDSHTILREEELEGRTCFVVESMPNKGTSQYSKRISWVDGNSFVVIGVDFYNKKGKKSKELRVKKLELIDDIWTSTETKMYDLKESHKTRIITKEIEYNKQIDDKIFTLRNLEED